VDAPVPLPRCVRCSHLEIAHARVAPRPCCEPVAALQGARAEVVSEFPVVDCPCAALALPAPAEVQ
jgi:hypothetical protein